MDDFKDDPGRTYADYKKLFPKRIEIIRSKFEFFIDEIKLKKILNLLFNKNKERLEKLVPCQFTFKEALSRATNVLKQEKSIQNKKNKKL